MMLTSWIERRPIYGILASFSGFSVTLLTWMHAASVVLGFAGAVLGFIAGCYTFLIKRSQWKRIKNNPDSQ
jgi:hypothetical protein